MFRLWSIWYGDTDLIAKNVYWFCRRRWLQALSFCSAQDAVHTKCRQHGKNINGERVQRLNRYTYVGFHLHGQFVLLLFQTTTTQGWWWQRQQGWWWWWCWWCSVRANNGSSQAAPLYLNLNATLRPLSLASQLATAVLLWQWWWFSMSGVIIIIMVIIRLVIFNDSRN